MKIVTSNRRDALRRMSGLLGSPLGLSQSGGGASKRTLPPINELITALEFDEVAKRALPASAYESIAGSDRAAFDRMTLRPRMCVPTVDLDLSVDLFGEPHFTPILVGPVGGQRQFHPDAEHATLRGAAAAKAGVILSSSSSVPVADLARSAKTPLWYAVDADAKAGSAEQIQQALAAGCKALCITAGATKGRAPAAAITRAEWTAIEQLRKLVDVPVLVKGVLTPQDATTAIGLGAKGLVVSSYGRASGPAAIDALPSVVDAVGNKAVVLVDGNFRRGTDILKALIMGASGVLVSRPVMWGLAAYGADGVQAVIALLQSDLGRHVAAIGVTNLKGLNRTYLKVHRQ